jgi:hypothetical protein
LLPECVDFNASTFANEHAVNGLESEASDKQMLPPAANFFDWFAEYHSFFSPDLHHPSQCATFVDGVVTRANANHFPISLVKEEKHQVKQFLWLSGTNVIIHSRVCKGAKSVIVLAHRTVLQHISLVQTENTDVACRKQ